MRDSAALILPNQLTDPRVRRSWVQGPHDSDREIAPGVAVSAIGFGGYHLGLIKDETEAIRVLHAAIDAGITFLDNAWEYNEHLSEERMGKASPRATCATACS